MSVDVTIVIPIFNSSSYISETLSSIKLATKKNSYEIILVDDCSEDISEIKKKIKYLSNVKLIQKAVKSNAAVSRNIGYLASKSNYVFFLDSDDRLLESSIDNRVKLHKRFSAGLIFGNFHLASDDNMIISNLPDYNNQDMRVYLFKENGDFRTSTISICKSFFKGTLFDPQSQKHQDWIYAIRCRDNNESIYFDKLSTVIITTNQNPNRMSSSYNFEASKYLCEKYLIREDFINSFSKKHWKQMILQNNQTAINFFLNLYTPRDIKENGEYMFFKALSNRHLLPISSILARKLKNIKSLIIQ